MKYNNIIKARFLSRPNRFIAQVEINGREETVHVKNTGRCRELLQPGAEVYLQESDNPNRKTRYDLIAVKKGEILVNMDSQIPNAVVEEWIRKGNLFSENATVKREQKYGNSRFDIYVEDGKRRAYIEVKGVTLEVEGTARFPDAPTLRGVKHIQELCKAVDAGYESYIIFIIQMKSVMSFEPNWTTHAQLGEALVKARDKGVHILVYDCLVTPDSIQLDQEIPCNLDR